MSQPVEKSSKLSTDALSGLLLLGAAALALVAANGPLAEYYGRFLDVPVSVKVGAQGLEKPALLWINDGLMAIFFLMIGLEVRREMSSGSLATFSSRTLPFAAALGGLLVPAGIFVALNYRDAAALNGWAVPVATDVAFALGILALAGNRLPSSLKIFLLAIAIFDDLAAIVIIALFYSRDLSTTSLLWAAGVIGVLLVLRMLKITDLSAYLVVGLVLWVFVLKSGVHATLAGVVVAFLMPHGGPGSAAHKLEKRLHGWVAFLILPLFAFANAGVALAGLQLSGLGQPVTAGVILGLVLGKPIGVMAFSWLAIRLGFAERPAGANWGHVLGVALLCGVGFTMSLFISSLAFEHLPETGMLTANRLGILVGSALSGVLGFALLRTLSRRSVH